MPAGDVAALPDPSNQGLVDLDLVAQRLPPGREHRPTQLLAGSAMPSRSARSQVGAWSSTAETLGTVTPLAFERPTSHCVRVSLRLGEIAHALCSAGRRDPPAWWSVQEN